MSSFVVVVATGCFPGLRRPRPVCPDHPLIVATATTGALVVKVIDKARREPVVGAHVIAAGLTALTDSCGMAVISGLAPGRHDLAILFADHTVDRPAIELEGGQVTAVYQKIDLTATTWE